TESPLAAASPRKCRRSITSLIVVSPNWSRLVHDRLRRLQFQSVYGILPAWAIQVTLRSNGDGILGRDFPLRSPDCDSHWAAHAGGSSLDALTRGDFHVQSLVPQPGQAHRPVRVRPLFLWGDQPGR